MATRISPNTGKYEPEKLRIRTLFTQCSFNWFSISLTFLLWKTSPVRNYMFKLNNRNTRTSCEICSKLTIKTPEQSHWRRSGVFIVNFEHISQLVLVFLLLTLSRWMPAERRVSSAYENRLHLTAIGISLTYVDQD